MKVHGETVLFGPFIGEFGWEVLFWQGWVRRACRTVFKDYHKVAASFPGRYPFYPDVDEFWGHPQEITSRKFVSSKGYTTDNWFVSLAERGQNRDLKKDAEELWEGSLLLDTLLEHYKKKLPDDALILSPAGWIDLPDLPPAVGTKPEKHDDGTFTLPTVHIPPQFQVLEPIRATEKGKAILQNLVAPDEKVIAIFPRARLTRRPDKNWPEEKYVALIDWISKKFTEFRIVVLGEPGGTYFADGTMPEGCVDLINIESESRMDVQAAALEQATIAAGSVSGATVFALVCGCPTLQWGPIEVIRQNALDNYLKTSIFYYPFANPAVSEIATLFDRFLRWHQNRQHQKAFSKWGFQMPLVKAQFTLWRYQYQLWRTGRIDQVELVYKPTQEEGGG
ncbi:glycosyltransferase family 9 protein [Chloroflexota bacterium]